MPARTEHASGSLSGHRSDGQGASASALGAICRLAKATAAEVIVYDAPDQKLRSIVASGASRLDLASKALCDAVCEQVRLVSGDVQPRWIAIEGQGSNAFLVLKLMDKGPHTFLITLSFADATAITRARVGKLAPDLLLLLRFHVDAEARRRELEESSLAARVALDHGECGVIAIRPDRSIMYCNEAAASYLSGERGLRVRGGRLGAKDAKRFDSALYRIIDHPQETDAGRLPAAVMLDKAPGKSRPLVIVIAPVRSSARRAEAGTAALIYIFDPAPGELRGLDALCQLHGLSGVERRLLIHLVSGLPLAEAAAQMRIKLETARTYLKQIFAKTDTHRQTDLIAIMSRYLRAFRGDFDFEPA